MKWKETKKMKNDIKLAEEQRKCEVYCKICGWKNHIYNVYKDRVLCKNCNNYVYRDDKSEFEYKMKEVMNKCKYSNYKKEDKQKMQKKQ